jgi:hypothetical protein
MRVLRLMRCAHGCLGSSLALCRALHSISVVHKATANAEYAGREHEAACSLAPSIGSFDGSSARFATDWQNVPTAWVRGKDSWCWCLLMVQFPIDWPTGFRLGLVVIDDPHVGCGSDQEYPLLLLASHPPTTAAAAHAAWQPPAAVPAGLLSVQPLLAPVLWCCCVFLAPGRRCADRCLL